MPIARLGSRGCLQGDEIGKQSWHKMPLAEVPYTGRTSPLRRFSVSLLALRTMTATWSFRKKTELDTDRDPIQGEFFSGEAIDDAAEALVRESIQNSLDNRRAEESVKVCIYISKEGEALLPSQLIRFTAGLFPHLLAERNGLEAAPEQRERCSWIAVEDFGTTGLTGDPATWNPADDEKNNFYSFFRAEGRSDKSGTEGGRWGVGKYVFPLCSRANSFFGYTVPFDTKRPQLLGRSILKSHRVGAVRYQPDGYFAAPASAGLPPMPIISPEIIGEFRHLFGLRRKQEPGLSIVVPWRIGEEDELTVESVRSACVKDYFLPLLSGSLTVEIRSGSELVVLNAGTAPEYAQADPALKPVVELARGVVQNGLPHEVRLDRYETTSAPRWETSMFSEASLREIGACLLDNEPITVRVPMRIHPRTGAKWTHFDVHMIGESGYGQARPYFIRNDIRVTGASRRTVQDVHAIVEIRDPDLSKLLGDAENPSHTEWRQETRGFKERYMYPRATLEFVKDSVREILRIVRQADSAPDALVLADLFPIGEESVGPPAARRRTKKDGKPITPPTPDLELPRRSRLMTVSRIPGGFRITNTESPVTEPTTISVRAAYDVERGNPFKTYSPFDFTFGKQITIDVTGGASLLEMADNRMEIEVRSSPFLIEVSGFDVNRDVVVNSTTKVLADV